MSGPGQQGRAAALAGLPHARSTAIAGRRHASARGRAPPPPSPSLAFSMYLARTMEASHTVVPRLLELGSCASCSVMLRGGGGGAGRRSSRGTRCKRSAGGQPSSRQPTPRFHLSKHVDGVIEGQQAQGRTRPGSAHRGPHGTQLCTRLPRPHPNSSCSTVLEKWVFHRSSMLLAT